MDLGEQRIQHMDATGIDVQVLPYSTPGTQSLPPAEAVPLAREANDQLAAAIKVYPDRLAGFATLPTPDPEAAAQELERAVRLLGFKGAMVNGRTGAHFLDDPMFQPLLEAVVALDVPIYLHPTVPSQAVQEAYYAGLGPAVSAQFATTGWGSHLGDGDPCAARLILAGVFDRYSYVPDLVLGHWGEMIPFYLARFNTALTPMATHVQRPIADYFTQQFYATPSGLFTLPPFLLTMQKSWERTASCMPSTIPMYRTRRPRTFLESAPISPADKENRPSQCGASAQARALNVVRCLPWASINILLASSARTVGI